MLYIYISFVYYIYVIYKAPLPFLSKHIYAQVLCAVQAGLEGQQPAVQGPELLELTVLHVSPLTSELSEPRERLLELLQRLDSGAKDIML